MTNSPLIEALRRADEAEIHRDRLELASHRLERSAERDAALRPLLRPVAELVMAARSAMFRLRAEAEAIRSSAHKWVTPQTPRAVGRRREVGS